MHGPDVNIENQPKQLVEALTEGFDIEVDVRVEHIYYEHDVNVGALIKLPTPKIGFTIGHDDKSSLSHVDVEYFNDLAKRFPNQTIWIHCKNVETMVYFNTQALNKQFNIASFFHQEDDVAYVEGGLLWTHPKVKNWKDYSIWSIQVLPELNMTPSEFREHFLNKQIFGVCTDYAYLMRKALT